MHSSLFVELLIHQFYSLHQFVRVITADPFLKGVEAKLLLSMVQL